jgi:nicotinamide-nucleotide amidase
MDASVIAIGDEIVGGLTVDTNSGFLAQLLRSAGVEPRTVLTVGDDEASIRRALERALDDAQIVITTGGLGPTADDLTTASVAALAGRPLVLDKAALAHIEERFRSRGLEMPANNRRQALAPFGSAPVPNPDGTAPGFICPVDRGGLTRHVICLPGVPAEMRRMAEETVLPWLRERHPGQAFGTRVFSTFGLSESKLDELLEGVVDPADARLSFRAAFPRVQARISLGAPSQAEAERRLDEMERHVRDRLGHHLYAVGDEGLEEAVGRLLRRAEYTLAVAESCTGGLIGHRLTDVPGSSAYFLLGVIAYSNDAKVDLLGVSPETLARHGAVSAETVEEMAARVRGLAGADLGLATSGIAGPGGGTEDKPVGTVCIALAHGGGTWSRRYDLGARSRDWVKEMTAQIALNRVRRHLEEESESRLRGSGN